MRFNRIGWWADWEEMELPSVRKTTRPSELYLQGTGWVGEGGKKWEGEND